MAPKELQSAMKLSICIPVYNGALTIGLLVETIRTELSDMDFEIILVNDGSPEDNSEEVCASLAQDIPEVRFIGLRRNFGEHNAVMCALVHSRGDYITVMDDDLQNPPSEILQMLSAAQNGFDVVYSRFEKKRHHWFRNFGSWFNNLVATWLLEKPRDLYLSSFKIISRPLVDEIIRYTGPFPYIDGLILRATDSIESVVVEHHERMVGRSNYTLKKLINLWMRMFINFSRKPLRIVMWAGGFFALISVLLGIIFFMEKIFHPETSQGWASIIVAVLFTGSMQMISLGLIGEYIGKIYLDINGTPQWTIKTRID